MVGRRLALLLCAAAALAVLALTLSAYLRGVGSYIDNGDGYYLYAARRVAQGAVLYRTVMGTQPPLVYLLGALIFKLGGGLTAIRLCSALLRVAATGLVYLCARRLWGGHATAALAALIYAALPIGLYWDRSFDVNPPLVLVSLLALWPLLHNTPRSVALSGLLGAVALYTKDLYLPLLLATSVYLLVRRRALLRPYLGGLLVGLMSLSLLLLLYAGPGGLHDAFLGQDASPLNLAWFVGSLSYVAVLDGAVVGLALLGLVFRHSSSTASIVAGSSSLRCADYTPWLLAGSGAVLLAALKEGTFGSVFQLAEPAVALLAAATVARALTPHPRRERRDRRAVPITALLGLLVVFGVGSLWVGDRTALAFDNAVGTNRVVALMEARTRPGATVWAPPYYALRSGTYLLDDAADTYILAQRYARGERRAVAVVARIDAALAAQRLPVVLLDSRGASIAPIVRTLHTYYHQASQVNDGLAPALHVTVWVPSS